MRSNRTVVVNLHTKASVGHIIEMLTDLPVDMELVDIDKQTDQLGWISAALTFTDHEGL